MKHSSWQRPKRHYNLNDSSYSLPWPHIYYNCYSNIKSTYSNTSTNKHTDKHQKKGKCFTSYCNEAQKSIKCPQMNLSKKKTSHFTFYFLEAKWLVHAMKPTRPKFKTHSTNIVRKNFIYLDNLVPS